MARSTPEVPPTTAVVPPLRSSKECATNGSPLTVMLAGDEIEDFADDLIGGAIVLDDPCVLRGFEGYELAVEEFGRHELVLAFFEAMSK